VTKSRTHEDSGQEGKEESPYRQRNASPTVLEDAESFWLDQMERGLIEQWRDRGLSPDELAAEMNGVATRLLEIALRLPAAPDGEKAQMSKPLPINEHDKIEEVESYDILRLGTPLQDDRLGDIALLVQASFDRVINPFLAGGHRPPTEQLYFALALAQCFLDEAEDTLVEGHRINDQTRRTLALTLRRMVSQPRPTEQR
jgi:hypothetical protein